MNNAFVHVIIDCDTRFDKSYQRRKSVSSAIKDLVIMWRIWPLNFVSTCSNKKLSSSSLGACAASRVHLACLSYKRLTFADSVLEVPTMGLWGLIVRSCATPLKPPCRLWHREDGSETGHIWQPANASRLFSEVDGFRNTVRFVNPTL